VIYLIGLLWKAVDGMRPLVWCKDGREMLMEEEVELGSGLDEPMSLL